MENKQYNSIYLYNSRILKMGQNIVGFQFILILGGCAWYIRRKRVLVWLQRRAFYWWKRLALIGCSMRAGGLVIGGELGHLV